MKRSGERSKKKWAAATIGVAVMGTLAAAVALGSPPSGVTITTLVTANFDETGHLNSDQVKFPELVQSPARGRTQVPERRIEVVAINDANPEPDARTIERK